LSLLAVAKLVGKMANLAHVRFRARFAIPALCRTGWAPKPTVEADLAR